MTRDQTTRCNTRDTCPHYAWQSENTHRSLRKVDILCSKDWISIFSGWNFIFARLSCQEISELYWSAALHGLDTINERINWCLIFKAWLNQLHACLVFEMYIFMMIFPSSGNFHKKWKQRTVIMRSLKLRNCSRKFDADAVMEYFWSDEFWLVWIDDYRVCTQFGFSCSLSRKDWLAGC